MDLEIELGNINFVKYHRKLTFFLLLKSRFRSKVESDKINFFKFKYVFTFQLQNIMKLKSLKIKSLVFKSKAGAFIEIDQGGLKGTVSVISRSHSCKDGNALETFI